MLGSWKPRYVLTDDSSIEQLAVQKAFPGLIAGEQNIQHLLCTVHSNRTLLRKLGSSAARPAYNLLRQAMFCFTGIKCRELCEEAIRVAPGDSFREYIRKHWLTTAPKWALFAWQHSPLLLQITTTNPCVSRPCPGSCPLTRPARRSPVDCGVCMVLCISDKGGLCTVQW